ncbi:hypothetical protein ACGFW5_35120 [Streptomyces sp. NPDC048416]|uniref:hypothetical protein n=1 Tax=Streptomyces sp. NPDC048416 TaxID=3365546 RepID=UPI00371A2FFE
MDTAPSHDTGTPLTAAVAGATLLLVEIIEPVERITQPLIGEGAGRREGQSVAGEEGSPLRPVTKSPGHGRRVWAVSRTHDATAATPVRAQGLSSSVAPEVRDACDPRPPLGGLPAIGSARPSPLSAGGHLLGSRRFSRTNERLEGRCARPVGRRLP